MKCWAYMLLLYDCFEDRKDDKNRRYKNLGVVFAPNENEAMLAIATRYELRKDGSYRLEIFRELAQNGVQHMMEREYCRDVKHIEVTQCGQCGWFEDPDPYPCRCTHPKALSDEFFGAVNTIGAAPPFNCPAAPKTIIRVVTQED